MSEQIWGLLEKVASLPILVCEDPSNASAWFIERDAVMDLMVTEWVQWEAAFATAASALVAILPPVSMSQLSIWNGTTFPALWKVLLACVAVDDARSGVLARSDFLRVVGQRLGSGWLDDQSNADVKALRSTLLSYGRGREAADDPLLSWVRKTGVDWGWCGLSPLFAFA